MIRLWSFYYGICFEVIGLAILLAKTPIKYLEYVGMFFFVLGFIQVGLEYKKLERKYVKESTEVKH